MSLAQDSFVMGSRGYRFMAFTIYAITCATHFAAQIDLEVTFQGRPNYGMTLGGRLSMYLVSYSY